MSGFDAEFLAELFAPCGTIRIRRMFGGHGVYANGLFFALTFQGDIYLKVDDGNRQDFLNEGLSPFIYDPGNGRKPVQLSYFRMPEICFDDPDALRSWTGGALSAAREAVLTKDRKPSVPRKKKPAGVDPAGLNSSE